jgi:hypothetical protein
MLALPADFSSAQAQGPAIEPEAMQLLKRMTDFLGGAQEFGVEAENWLEDVSVSGEKIQYGFTSDLKIKRPDRLRAERTAYRSKQEFLYDGKTLTIYDPATNHYASEAAPDNIDELLHFARDTLDIVPPVGDLVFTNAYDLLTSQITSAKVVGKALLDGVVCDHLAFTSPLVDWQVWISEGDKPLPYRYVLTTMDDPAYPQYTVTMSNWNLDLKFDKEVFEFAMPAGATEIDFLRIDAEPSSAP